MMPEKTCQFPCEPEVKLSGMRHHGQHQNMINRNEGKVISEMICRLPWILRQPPLTLGHRVNETAQFVLGLEFLRGSGSDVSWKSAGALRARGPRSKSGRPGQKNSGN